MQKNIFSRATCLLFLSLGLFSCKPKEREIPMPGGEEKWVINSRTLDNGDVLVSVCRTLAPDELNIGNGKKGLDKIMVDDIYVITRHETRIDTLERLSKGIFLLPSARNRGLAELSVFSKDGKRHLSAQAAHLPKAQVDSITPEARVVNGDTLCAINLQLSHTPGKEKGWYLVSFQKWDANFNVVSRARISLSQVLQDHSGMNEKVLLISSDDFTSGVFRISKKLPHIAASDTLVVNVSRIEKGYYDFVQAQLKSSHWLNQLMAEVISYPSNVVNGLGYFTLHEPRIHIYRMSEFIVR